MDQKQQQMALHILLPLVLVAMAPMALMVQTARTRGMRARPVAMLATAVSAELVVMVNVNMAEREALEEISLRDDIAVEQAAEAALRGMVAACDPNVTPTIVIEHQGFPAEAILGAAAAEGVDLIVIASHGRSGMTRWMLGSVAEKVSRVADVPVLIVPARD